MEKLAGMRYNELVKVVDTGEVSIKQLREYYSRSRKQVMDRRRTFSKSEFAEERKIDKPMSLKNIVTSQQLVQEIHDVNKILRSKSGTVGGYRKQRAKTIEALNAKGIDVDWNTYGDWITFNKWFHASKWDTVFDSTSEEVNDVFAEEPAGPAEVWNQLFLEMQKEVMEG